MPFGGFLAEYGTLIEWASVALLVAALALSYVVLTRVGDVEEPFAPLRARFVRGVPWGTLVVVVGVYGVFHLLQGAGEPGGPNVVGFRSWSLWHPETILMGAFSHASNSHLTGNLLATVVFAPIVEYAWGHYPDEDAPAESVLSKPAARIGLFVLATFLVGVGSTLLVPGAIIGFSGVVFAFAGFALVARPLLALGGMLGLQVVDLVYDGLTDPLAFAEGDTRFVTPSWSNTALQGHLYGMVVGVLLAVVLFRYRKVSPKFRYIWFAALVFAVSRSMWAIFWFLGEAEFVLFRGVGAAAVLLLATVVTLAALQSDQPLLPEPFSMPAVPVPSARTLSIVVLVFLVATLGVTGLAYNLVPVTPQESTQGGIEIDGYTVTYAEGVEDRYTAIDLPVVRELLSVQMSGVVVTSDERNVWALDTPADELAFDGRTAVVVGDVTWREVVVLNHTQWELSGGNTTYKVFGQHWQVDDEQTLLFSADPAEAEPTINGSRISIEPSEAFYEVVVERDNETLGQERIPSQNESVEVDGIEFERQDDRLIATHDRTELPIAEYRTERDRS